MSIHSRVQQSRFESASQEAVVSLLAAGGSVLQRMNDLLREHGITHDQYNILRILRGVHPAGHPRYAIAERLVSRAPDVTRLLDRLVRQGLVARGWSPENRRHSIATITNAGLTLLATVDPVLHALQKRLTAGLRDDELVAFARICDRMAEAG
jgi:DNA-binding MarR family transcriptional regulator